MNSFRLKDYLLAILLYTLRNRMLYVERVMLRYFDYLSKPK